jgi:hypothetical protein
MTSHITNTITDTEWEDGDDSALYDNGWNDGIIKCIKILDDIRLEPQVDRLPTGFTLSVVIGTLRKILEEGE